MALIPWRTATVVGIENETPDTRRFKLNMDELDRFDFVPGQFITLDLPIHEKPNKRWRSYSIASYPDGSNQIELLIVLNPEGLGTNYLFNEVVVGSISSTTARVRSWNSTTNKLEVSIVSGEFLTSETIVGSDSGASHVLRVVDVYAVNDGFADNENIENEADSIIDFSETNPFGMP